MGGGGVAGALGRLQSTPIDAQALIEAVRGDGDGAVALFLGTVRDHSTGKEGVNATLPVTLVMLRAIRGVAILASAISRREIALSLRLSHCREKVEVYLLRFD